MFGVSDQSTSSSNVAGSLQEGRRHDRGSQRRATLFYLAALCTLIFVLTISWLAIR